ncbi:MAG: glycosyltransferase family 4 protein [Acaryochloridaceae cyanobacterium SU_2_1]|nr:glycosyltransferase family 4 protein [Acaryochloridaceae cyanobacterium SU_2_1]
MKTLQIGMDWFPDKQGGGLDRYYYDLTRFLPTIGVEARGLVTGPENLSEQTLGQIHAFAPRQSPILKRLWSVRQQSQRLLGADQFSLYVSHFVLYTFPILDQLQQRPLIVHFHGPWSLESIIEGNKSWGFQLRKAMELAVFRRASCFIVLSEAFKDILHNSYQVPREKIQVIPGGVERGRFETHLSSSEARVKLGWPQGRFIIFTARRLSRRMGLDNLVQAMSTICQTHPELLLLIAGKGELEAALQTQIQALGLTHHIQLLGYVSDADLPLAYRAADLAVLPTTSLEGFGLVVLESLAAGTPILGTPIGGIPEILESFCPDLLFEGYEPEQLARGIQEVLSGSRHLPSAETCQNHIRDYYDWPIIAQRVKSIYQDLLDQDSLF